MMATSTPMAHHCLRPDQHGHGFSHMMLRLRSLTDASCPLTAGHVGHLLQLLQDGVHAGGCLLHLLSKVPQHADGQQRHFKLRWRILARLFSLQNPLLLQKYETGLYLQTMYQSSPTNKIQTTTEWM